MSRKVLLHAAACWSGFLQGSWPRLIDRCLLCCWAAFKIIWAVLCLAAFLDACVTKQFSEHLLVCSRSLTTRAACKLQQAAHVLADKKARCKDAGAARQRSQAEDTCA